MFSPLSLFLWFTIISSAIIGVPGLEMLRLPLFLLFILIVGVKSVVKVKKINANLVLLIFAVYPLIQFLVLQGKLLATIQATIMVVAMLLVGNFVMHQKIDKNDLETIAKYITFGMFAFYYNAVGWNGRSAGLFGNPNATAYMALTLLPLILMFSSSKKIKTIAVINVLCLIIYTASRGALMALLLGYIAYLIVKKFKFGFLGIWTVALSCLFVSVYALDIAAYLVETFVQSEEVKAGTRLLRVDSNGRGKITTMAYNRFFSSGTEFFGLGFDKAKFDIGDGIAAHAGTHNSYLETLLKLGYIGVAFSAFYLLFLTNRIRGVKSVKYRSIIAMQLTVFLSLATNASVFMVVNYYFFYFIVLIEVAILEDKKEYNLIFNLEERVSSVLLPTIQK